MALLQDLATRLAVPGLPEWTGLLALLVLLLVGLAYLLMPFSVFGLKGRLDSLEAQLDDIQNEIRSLALRLPDGPRRAAAQDWVDLPAHTARPVEEAPRRATPPVPPPAAWPEDSRGGRSEPRLDWPRR
ncbi:hypothetical protein GCM10011504_11740 [Siccirubricoccus deserti]|uniref:Uncharacterized protein n=1 Tax=Siccirubricoccus deserti TaxID=2013562 RepID=A0A9X0QVN6_9PROT|nr:hypothetical protein [Siccirubricoccus deserti]MBC4014789.1 hypothetical protein [Siccirubricoccus deserti]GGC35012.1 hypothetical protein GCM10011504_11740 [Siccirubricoccus deserti]